jgi:sec-independent protein translocase protein TatA
MENFLFTLFSFGMYEAIVIFAVVLLLFGGKKIPELMKGLGKGIKEFNSARSAIESEIKSGMKEVDEKKTQTEEKE